MECSELHFLQTGDLCLLERVLHTGHNSWAANHIGDEPVYRFEIQNSLIISYDKTKSKFINFSKKCLQLCFYSHIMVEKGGARYDWVGSESKSSAFDSHILKHQGKMPLVPLVKSLLFQKGKRFLFGRH